ncbi:DUF2207 domain-containing protein [Desulfovibrio sp. OttesenSCG-928-M14]|nr:DUF2207 domain-containing protein [Desulfovibrio sp. OttesenSCG-928-M14]
MRCKKLILAGLVLFLLGLSTFPLTAMAEERVLSFDVTAELQADASMIVTERIKVNIEHKIIRQGITHAFPIKEPYDDTKIRHYGFELLSVKLDGKPVNYHEDRAGFHTGIAVGTAGKAAPLGVHTYEIVYRTTGHVRPMPERDEIYFNVMGNNWAFPVDHVSFTLRLPAGGPSAFLESVAFTGAPGETGEDYETEGNHTIRTTRPLKPGEGLTVAIAWEKGIVSLPGESFANLVGANRTVVLLGIFVIILLYFIGSRRLFRSNYKGAVVPIFSAPEGMSPGYVAAIKAMAYKGRMLHADIIWAAVNGFLRVDARDKKSIVLHKINEKLVPPRMKSGGKWGSEECRKLRDQLLWGSATELNFATENGKTYASIAFEYLEKKYSAQQQGFWTHNYIPVVPGALLFFALFSWVLPYIYSPCLYVGEAWGGVMGYLCITIVLFGLCGGSVWGTRKAFKEMTGMIRLIPLVGFPLLAFGCLAVLWSESHDDYFFLFMFAASLGVTVWFIANVQGKYTAKGHAQFLKVQGLEMYIRTAEKNRLAKLNAPEDTIEKFEELLPYAVALGCAEAWQKRFETLLAELDYAPEWMESGDSHVPYRSLMSGMSGMAVAANACASLAHSYKASKAGSSGTGGSGFGSGSRGGSVGGGSGGSNVGGW